MDTAATVATAVAGSDSYTLTVEAKVRACFPPAKHRGAFILRVAEWQLCWGAAVWVAQREEKRCSFFGGNIAAV